MDTPRPAAPAMPGEPGVPLPGAARQPRTALLAVADDPRQAGRALASGADLIDVSGMGAPERTAVRARYPRACMWTGPAAGPEGTGRAAAPAGGGPGTDVFDADQAAGMAGHSGGDATVAAVVAAAAVGTWLGAAVIRTRHVPAVRLAIDMTSAIAGTRPPALTVRGLA